MTERFEPYEIVPDEKVRETRDSKSANAVNYLIRKEDHTIGNLLRMQLLKDPKVIYAGYKHPHPLESHIIVSVQTDSSTDPNTAFNNAITSLREDIDCLSTSFDQNMMK